MTITDLKIHDAIMVDLRQKITKLKLPWAHGTRIDADEYFYDIKNTIRQNSEVIWATVRRHQSEGDKIHLLAGLAGGIITFIHKHYNLAAPDSLTKLLDDLANITEIEDRHLSCPQYLPKS